MLDFAPRRSPLVRPVADDSTAHRDKSLWVVAGALIGAAGGLYVYKRHVDRTNDGDFAPGLSIPLYAGAGAILGGFLGFLAAAASE